MHLDVYVRSCSRVVAVNKTPRPLNIPKTELSPCCIASLIHSLSNLIEADKTRATVLPRIFIESVTLTVLDDHSDPEHLDALKRILNHARFPANLRSLEQTGNGSSLKATYTLARETGRELIYFVEDDYLHDPQAIESMIDGFLLGRNQFGKDVCIFPCDYIDLYRHPQVSTVFLGRDRYWRHIESTTGTVMVTASILASHWHCFMGLAQYDEARWVREQNTINLVYKDYPCLSPMPSLALHMHEGIQSPYIPWQQWLTKTRHVTSGYLATKPEIYPSPTAVIRHNEMPPTRLATQVMETSHEHA